MYFSSPVKPGECICYTSKIVYTGKSSLVAYVKVARVSKPEVNVVDGFITFVHVDENTKACPHGITVDIETDEEIRLSKMASALGR